jgi:peroxiredoxin
MEHAVQLRGDRRKFQRAGLGVVLVGLGTAERAQWFCQEKRIRFACLTDPTKAAHRAYGLGRASLRQLLGPQDYLRWAKLNLLRETRQGLVPKEDPTQMPGTFVIDTEGIVRFAHRNRHPADNPSNDAVLDAAGRLGILHT